MTRDRTERIAWIVGAVGLVGSAIGWIIAPRLFAHGWLAAFACWIGWPLGSMAVLLIHSITGGRWGEAIRPQLVLGVATLPLALPAVVPLLLELRPLYPWAQPAIASTLGNTAYLNVPFFLGRGVLYLIVWFGLGGLILRAANSDLPLAALYRLAPVGLITLMLTATFGGFDAVLSRDPHFNSSIFGMIMAAEGTLFALSIGVLITLLVAPPERRVIADMAKVILGIMVLWGYFEFMQLLIVWNSDLAADAPWYVIRAERGWSMVAAFVFVFHFLLPFFLLLWPAVQRSRRAMLGVSGMLVVAELPRSWWLAVPGDGRTLSWVDVCAMAALGGVALGWALRAPRLPILQRAVHHA